MPTYEVTGPSGTVIEMEGDSPPTEADIDAAFAAIKPTAPVVPSSSGGADLAGRAAAAYTATAPNIGANLNLRDAQAQGGETLSLSQASPIARERPYDILGAATGSGGSEAANFTKQFRAAPVGQAFEDRDLGQIVKTGDNTFRRVGPSPQRQQTAGDISIQLLNQVSDLDVGGALRTIQPGFNSAGNLAVRSGGLVASALAPELRLPGLILGSTGELAGQVIDTESAGQDPLNWRNYSLPAIAGAGLVSTVGSGATAPRLGQAIAQGGLEGAAIQAPQQAARFSDAVQSPTEIDPETGLSVLKKENFTDNLRRDLGEALPMIAMGAAARGSHGLLNTIQDLRNPRLPQIESAPASYTDQGIANAQAARQAEGNTALADAFQGEQNRLQGIDATYQNNVATQAPAQAQGILDQIEEQGVVDAQRRAAVLNDPSTPQSAYALRRELILEARDAARANRIAERNRAITGQIDEQVTGRPSGAPLIAADQSAEVLANPSYADQQAAAQYQRFAQRDQLLAQQSAQEAEAAQAAQAQQAIDAQNQYQRTLAERAAQAQQARVNAAQAAQAAEAQRLEQIAQTRREQQAAQIKQQRIDDFTAARAEEINQQVRSGQLQGIEQTQIGNDPLRNQISAIETRPGLSASERARVEAQQAAVAPQSQFPPDSTAELSPQAQRMQDQYGRALPIALPTIAGAGVGGAIGATQGDTPQERLQNTLLGAGAGGLLGAGGTAAARLAQPELNAGEQVLAKASKPPSLANIVAETASHVEGSPAGVQRASNALTQTPKLPTIQESVAKQSAVDTLSSKIKSGLKKAGKALTQGDSVPNPDGSMAHPAGSDVSRSSLEKLGYTVPEPSTLPPTKGNFPEEMTGEQYNALRAQEAQAAQAQQQAIQTVEENASAFKPLPEDTEFLYEQKYNTRSGPKSERYYQMERTPENPRGRTVDEATLRAEGYDTSGLPGPEENTANARSSQFAGTIGSGGTQGAINRRALGILAGTATGGVTGLLTADEKDDKLVHALSGAVIGGLLSAGIMKGADALTRGKVLQELDVMRRNIINESIPRLASASEDSANAVFRYANAPQAAGDVAKDLQAKVLGSQYKSPEFSRKIGTILTEERLRGIKKSFEDAGNVDAAKDVVSTIGRKDGAFATEAEYQAALKDPQIQQAIDSFKKTVQPLAESNHLLTGGFESRAEYEAAVQDALLNGKELPSVKLAAPGPNTGTFVNLQPAFDEGIVGGSSPKGNLRNPLQKRSAFSKAAMGTAEEYNTDANSLIERMVKGNYEDAAKRTMYAQLEKDGLGVSLPAGEKPVDLASGKYGKKILIEERGSGNKTTWFWPDKSVANELGVALNTDGPLNNQGLASKVRAAMNIVQMRGLTDPVVHGFNILAGVASAPGGDNFLTQVFRGIPIASSFDAIGKIGSKAIQVMADSPAIREQVANLSRIGGIRPTYEEAQGWMSRLLHNVDKGGRLALDDLYQTLVDRGLVVESEEGRRNFVNRIGQYNSRLMGKYSGILKESGVSPFLVAGKNFNAIGLKQAGALAALSTGGVKAANAAASLKLRAAQTIGAYSTLVVIPAAINYLAWGDPGGPPGTPLGKIAISQDDEGKMTYFDPAQLTLLRRGMRATGLQAVVTGAQTGDNLNHVGGQAWRDVRNSLIHPYAGPVPTAVSTLLTGSSPTFHKIAEDVTPIGQSPDTLRQLGANAKAAFRNVNPMQGAFVESATPKPGEEGLAPGESILPGLGNMLMDLGGAAGVRKSTPLSEDTGELHQAQDDRFDANKNRKKLVESIILNSTGENGQLDMARVRAQIQTPEIQQAIRENPLQAQLLKNEIKNAVKDKLQGREKTDIAPKFTVAEGERAQFYLNKISTLSPEEGQQYLREQRAKGDLTRKVLQQMNYLRSRQ